ncbi:MAG: hypothetical protein LQ339_003739 [Xanthoria mediterranea]|nr:MAG: hypothetical protein LQ339_003739 [Xanthoria mediterranea]
MSREMPDPYLIQPHGRTITRIVTATFTLTVTSTSTTVATSTKTSTTSSSRSSTSESTSTTAQDTSSPAPTDEPDEPAGPTAILGSLTGAPEFIDDANGFVDLPIQIEIGQDSSSRVYVSSNGIISFFEGTTDYSNVGLPAAYLPAVALFPFWDDTYIAQGSTQGVFYTLSDDYINLALQFYFTRYDEPNKSYNYTVSYSTNQPGFFTFTYYQISDQGISATVGAQYGSPLIALQHSVNSATVTPGLVLTVDTIGGTITRSNIAV